MTSERRRRAAVDQVTARAVAIARQAGRLEQTTANRRAAATPIAAAPTLRRRKGAR
jgi:hypothetical protein